MLHAPQGLIRWALILSVSSFSLVTFFPSPAYSILGLCSWWSKTKEYMEDSERIAALAELPLTELQRGQLELFRVAVEDCSVSQAIKLAEYIPGTTITGPVPTTISGAVQVFVDALTPKMSIPLTFGELTRTAYEDPFERITQLTLPFSGAHSNGRVMSGEWVVGSTFILWDAQLPESEFLFPADLPESRGFIEIVSVVEGDDSFEAVFRGMAGDASTAVSFPFLYSVERIDADRILIQAIGVSGIVQVEAGNDCDDSFVTLPIDSVTDPLAPHGGAVFARDIIVFDGAVSMPYEIRIRVGTNTAPSNELVFSGTQVKANTVPEDNCVMKLCTNQSDDDGDGVGDICDNCPSTANAQQWDSDNDGVGDACQQATATPGAAAISLVASPNPSRGPVTVSYRVAAATGMSMRVYDLSGRLVTTLHEGSVDAGSFVTTWDGRNDLGQTVAGGTYLVQMRTGEHDVMTTKVAILD